MRTIVFGAVMIVAGIGLMMFGAVMSKQASGTAPADPNSWSYATGIAFGIALFLLGIARVGAGFRRRRMERALRDMPSRGLER